MKLSIIVPVYNVAGFIVECLDSILRQTFLDYELILVDDGSTDRSGDLCEEYAAKDGRVVVVHRSNGGASAARNTGLGIAKGEYLTFVDPDDFIEDGTYADNMTILLADKSIDILQYPTIIYPSLKRPRNQTAQRIEGSIGILAQWWSGDNLSFTVWDKIYKREVFSGVRFAEGHISEDTRMVAALYSKAKCVVTTLNGAYYYRHHNQSVSYVYTFSKHIDLFDAHLLIYKELRRYKSLSWTYAMAYERLLRRLIQAKKSAPDGDITDRLCALGEMSPSIGQIRKTSIGNKYFILFAKILSPKMFIRMYLFVCNFRHRFSDIK